MPFNIGVDLDGVQVDFQAGWSAAYHEWFGVKIPAAKLTAYDSWRETTHFHTEAEFFGWINSIPRFWQDLPPVAGALGAVYRLAVEQRHNLSILTSRDRSVRGATVEWVHAHYPRLPAPAQLPVVYHTARSQKGGVEHVQVFIDDDPETLVSLRHKPCVIVFDQPWNRGIELSAGMHRCKGWDEVVNFISRLDGVLDEQVSV